MTFGMKDTHKMLFILESFFKIGGWEAVIFLQASMNLYLHISQTILLFKEKNATSQSATFVTLIFLK
jgi:hypothetical protein